MSNFDLFIDDDNEIKFDVQIEGTESGSVSSKLVIETGSGFEVGFEASKVTGNEIHFVVPSMKNVLREGNTPARLEVFIDDRRFVPLDLVVGLKKSVKVEAAVRTTRTVKSPTVTATVLNESKPTTKSKSKVKKKRTLEDLISSIERK